MELLYYFLKVSACTILFFAFYLLVLRKLTFFKINRFYLLITLVISFIIPTLHFTLEREIEQPKEIITPTTIIPDTEILGSTYTAPIIVGNELSVEQNFNYYSLLPYLYLIIVVGLLVIAIWRLFQLIKHTKNSVEEINGLKLVSKKGGFTNCSFFNYVFIDEGSLTETELNILLKHEEVHAKQLHSIDKIIMMILKAVLWFNPVIYLYDKALEQAHEYEADEVTSKNCGTSHYASLLLRLAISKSEMPLVHNFVKSPIKERIKMLFNSKSKNMKKLMYLLALPIGLGLLWGFTIDVVSVSPKVIDSAQDQEFTLVLDAAHGGKNTGAKANGIAEKDITMVMAKKIKAIAETNNIKVVLTRSKDEYVELTERAKAKGTILLSLHVNSSPSKLQNGVEMFTSGTYDDKEMKLAKSNSISYYLYKSLKNISGIKISNKPKLQRLVVLDQASMPGIILEMGYLTNNSDFKFITNEQKQDELAKLIVDGVTAYQKASIPTAESVKLQESMKEFNAKYDAWKKSELYKRLTDESKNFKPQTLIGKIQSLNYINIGGVPTLDGFILSTSNKFYRIYIGREEVKSSSFKVGDEISLYAPKAEVWFDSNYPAIKPKTITVLKSIGVAPANLMSKPNLISSSTLNVDTKTDITYIKNGVMEIGDAKLVAEDITWDQHLEIITAKNATLTTKNGDKIVSKSIVYDLKKGSFKSIATGAITTKLSPTSPYIVNKSPEIENPTFSAAYHLLKNLKVNNDSLKMNIMLDKVLLLTGKVNLNVDGYALTGRVLQVDKDSNLITAHLATFTDKNGVKVSGDVIEFDLISKNYKVTQPVGAAYAKQ